MGRMIGSELSSVNSRLLGLCCLVACLFGLALPSLSQEQADEEAGDPTVDVVPTDDDVDDEADAEAEAEQAALAQAALESELASARRFEAELEALLLADGQLDTAQDDAQTKLTSLATRCGILSNSAMHEEVRLVLLGYQARALAALASIPPEGDDPGQAEQLNDVAQQIAAIDLPGAAPAADYWLLIADMIRQMPNKQASTKRLVRTEQALNIFIRKYEQDPDAAEYLVDTRLSLAQLLDQRGAQRGVAEQLKQIGELPEDSPRLGESNRLRERIAKWQTPIAFESLSTQLVNWNSTDHIGKPVLIHVYADSVESSVRMIDVISRRIVEGSLSGIAVVSLRVGDPVAGSSTPPWPALPVQLEPGGVLDQLGVTALPTLAWLDSEGRLASIGTTAAVLDQLESIQPDEPEEEANEPKEADEPDAEAPAKAPAAVPADQPEAAATVPEQPAEPDGEAVENSPF